MKKPMIITGIIFLVLVPLIVAYVSFINLSQYSNLDIQSNASQWNDLQKITDVVGDAKTGMSDDELLISNGGNIIQGWDFVSGSLVNTFNLTTVTSSCAAIIRSGDIDGDSKNEIVVGVGNVLEFYKKNGNSWTNYYNYTGCNVNADCIGGVDIADVNNNGKNEVVVKCGGLNTRRVFYNGLFAILSNSTGRVNVDKQITVNWQSYYNIAVGNLNNNNYKEIFVGDEDNSKIRVFEYNGADYTNIANFSYPSGSGWSMTVADYMYVGDAVGNGENDLLMCGNSQRVSLISYVGGTYKHVWSPANSVCAGFSSFTQYCGMGDFNANGKPEILASCSGTADNETIFEKITTNAGEYNYSKTWVYTHPSSGSDGPGPMVGDGAVGDFDNDGRPEFSVGFGNYYIIYNNDTSPYGPAYGLTRYASISNSEVASAGDVDNNGGNNAIYYTNYDIKKISISNNDTYLYFLIEVNGTIDFSNPNERFSIYLGSDIYGFDRTPQQNSLPFKYNYEIRVENNACNIYQNINQSIAVCDYKVENNQLQVFVKQSEVNVNLNNLKNLTFESGSDLLRYDLAPDYPAFIKYKVNDGTMPRCGDGYCDKSIGENCNTCSEDCISGQSALCGDGVCHGFIWGETCNTCSSDCFKETILQGSCSACKKGKCDGVCQAGESSSCRDCIVPINTCCGDGVCNGNENAINCQVDCNGNLPPVNSYCCGDSTCNGIENNDNCATDCS